MVVGRVQGAISAALRHDAESAGGPPLGPFLHLTAICKAAVPMTMRAMTTVEPMVPAARLECGTQRRCSRLSGVTFPSTSSWPVRSAAFMNRRCLQRTRVTGHTAGSVGASTCGWQMLEQLVELAATHAASFWTAGTQWCDIKAASGRLA
jgi:hypothetical protein